MQAAGIDRNTPVSVNLKEVPFRKALTTILSEVGGGAANLGYTIDDGVITISTADDLNSAKYQVVRVFDIRDMLVQPDTQHPAPYLQPSRTSPRAGRVAAAAAAARQQQQPLHRHRAAAKAGTQQDQKSKDDIVKESLTR